MQASRQVRESSTGRISCWGKEGHTECVWHHLPDWGHELDKEREKEKSMQKLAFSSPQILICRLSRSGAVPPACLPDPSELQNLNGEPREAIASLSRFLSGVWPTALRKTAEVLAEWWYIVTLAFLVPRKWKLITWYEGECGSGSLWFCSANIQSLELVAKGLIF